MLLCRCLTSWQCRPAARLHTSASRMPSRDHPPQSRAMPAACPPGAGTGLSEPPRRVDAGARCQLRSCESWFPHALLGRCIQVSSCRRHAGDRFIMCIQAEPCCVESMLLATSPLLTKWQDRVAGAGAGVGIVFGSLINSVARNHKSDSHKILLPAVAGHRTAETPPEAAWTQLSCTQSCPCNFRTSAMPSEPPCCVCHRSPHSRDSSGSSLSTTITHPISLTVSSDFCINPELSLALGHEVCAAQVPAQQGLLQE